MKIIDNEIGNTQFVFRKDWDKTGSVYNENYHSKVNDNLNTSNKHVDLNTEEVSCQTTADVSFKSKEG